MFLSVGEVQEVPDRGRWSTPLWDTIVLSLVRCLHTLIMATRQDSGDTLHYSTLCPVWWVYNYFNKNVGNTYIHIRRTEISFLKWP